MTTKVPCTRVHVPDDFSNVADIVLVASLQTAYETRSPKSIDALVAGRSPPLGARDLCLALTLSLRSKPLQGFSRGRIGGRLLQRARIRILVSLALHTA